MSNKIISIIRGTNQTTTAILKSVASNVKSLRLGRNISQKEFAKRVGIALPTYRRFETTGEISLRKLVEIARFFDMSSDIVNVFAKKEYSSLEEVISQKSGRKRASRND